MMNRQCMKWLESLLTGVFLAFVPAVWSATYYVDDVNGNNTNDGTSWEMAKATIQVGIDTSEEGDTVLVAPGRYTGEENKNIEFRGKNLTLKSTDGPEKTIIDCEGSGRGIYIHPGETNAVVDGFSITGANSEGVRGGKLRNCWIYGNSSRNGSLNGGGAYESVLINCKVHHNMASGAGASMNAGALVNPR